MKSPILIILFFATLPIFAQKRISGTVVDKNHQPIEYANIGIVNADIGTVCNNEGIFSLIIPNDFSQDSITVQHMSYVSKKFSSKEATTPNFKIVLKEKSNTLSEVIINPNKTKDKWHRKGRKFTIGSIQSSDSTADYFLGGELGVTLNLKGRGYPRQINFTTKKCTYDSILFQVNCFIIDQDREISILNKPIYHKVMFSEKAVEHNIPIEEIALLDSKKVTVSLQFVEIYGKGVIDFPVYTGYGFIRKVSLGQYDEIPINLGLALKMTYPKD